MHYAVQNLRLGRDGGRKFHLTLRVLEYSVVDRGEQRSSQSHVSEMPHSVGVHISGLDTLRSAGESVQYTLEGNHHKLGDNEDSEKV